jgi:hypothetical protein
VEDARELFAKADAALIAAKKGGRDRVVDYGSTAHTAAVEAVEAPSGLAKRKTGPRTPETRAKKGGESW